MDKANEPATPIAVGIKLVKEESESELRKSAHLPYKQAVGLVIFLAWLTRCDISYVVHLVSQFTSCYNESTGSR